MVNSNNNRLKADINIRTICPAEFDVIPEEIAFPGEYEIKGIDIQGWQVLEESTPKFIKTVFAVTWEDMKFVFLGHISKPLPPEVIEEIDGTDVLFVPTGEHFISPEDAAKLVKQIEPKVVVPAYSKDADAFMKALGQKSEAMDKFVFKKREIAEKKGQLVLIEAKA